MHDSALVTFSAIACVLVLLPVSIHVRARNYATVFNIIWLFLMNLNIFINSVHFWDNSVNDIPVFCDISTKITVALATALSACSLCINRRLASIAASRSITTSQTQKRLSLAIDIGLCIGAPIMVMGLSFIPQGQRFLVLEGIGCTNALLPVLPAIFLVYIWPVALGLVSMIYGGIAIRYFLARRLQFRTLLKSSQSGLSTGQYFRLMAMASADLFLGMPLHVAVLVYKSRNLIAWPGIKNVYSHWGFVREINEASFDVYFTDVGSTSLSLLLSWIAPLLAFVFFVLFGVTDDAIRVYSRWYNTTVKLIRPRSTQISPQMIPKLGTAVARPAGYDWNETSSAKDLDPERGFEGMSTVPSVEHQNGRPGLAVSVYVDRHVV